MSNWQETEGKSGSKVVAHKGGVVRTRAQLAECPTPKGTDTWKPIPHSDLISTLISTIEAKGITVGDDGYATYAGDLGLLGFIDLNVPGVDTDGYTLAMGVSTANNRKQSLRLVVGARVFVCDNCAFGGGADAVYLRRKHSSGLDLGAVIPPAIDRFLLKSSEFPRLIEAMKETHVTDENAKALLYDAFRGGVIPQRLLGAVGKLYFEDEEQRKKFPERTLWGLNNAFTEAAKVLATTGHKSPVAKAGCEYRIGSFFADRARGTVKPIELPALPDDVELYNGGLNDDIAEVLDDANNFAFA